MTERYLWIAGSIPFILLGAIHLLYTFFTRKFSARNALVNRAMKETSPLLTRSTSMWKAWIGFNASHSWGAIYIGIINLFLALEYFTIIKHPLFLVINLCTVFFYLWLAKKYWFSTPFRGILFAAICFVTASVIIIFQ